MSLDQDQAYLDSIDSLPRSIKPLLEVFFTDYLSEHVEQES